jgi:hypothetical protein
MESPFKFLDPYELRDRNAFFGRDDEIRDLYNLVSKNRLTFVYGPSGTGKTSLVQCGLADRFGGIDWLPIFIRRGHDLNESLRRELGKALGLPAEQGYEGDLADAVTALFNRYLRPVYLIFDQFEELFILGDEDDHTERQPFYNTIADLLDAELPCRLLFIVREDYFGYLNQFERTVPELYSRKIRVEPMNRAHLKEVITGSCKVYDIGLDAPQKAIEQITDNIIAGKNGIHMPYVQVYLHMLFQRAATEQHAENAGTKVTFTLPAIQELGPINDVLGLFLKDQEVQIGQHLKKQQSEQEPAAQPLPDDFVRRVLDIFATDEGTKVPIRYHMEGQQVVLEGKLVERLAALPARWVSAGVLALEKSRILRRSENEFELAHDTLAALINQQRTVEQRQLAELRRRLEAAYQDHLDLNGHYFLDKLQLARYESVLEHLDPKPEWMLFIKNSQAEAQREEEEEHERVQRELRLSKEKLAAEQRAKLAAITNLLNEQKSRKKQSRLLWAIACVAALAIVFGISAWKQRLNASAAKQKTAEQLIIALEEQQQRLSLETTNLISALEQYERIDYQPLIAPTRQQLAKKDSVIRAIRLQIEQLKQNNEE